MGCKGGKGIALWMAFRKGGFEAFLAFMEMIYALSSWKEHVRCRIGDDATRLVGLYAAFELAVVGHTYLRG
jgi:hypothetical protein